MAERSEVIISWNLPNFVTFALMIALIWIIIGTASHMLWRKPQSKQNVTSNGAGTEIPMAA